MRTAIAILLVLAIGVAGAMWLAQLGGTVQIQVGEADVAKQRNQVKMDVRKAYFGLQLSRDSISLLGDAAANRSVRSTRSAWQPNASPSWTKSGLSSAVP